MKKGQNAPSETAPKLAPTGHHRPQPPKDLKPPGRELWSAIIGEYAIKDSGPLSVLADACRAADTAAECCKIIAKDGLTISTKSGKTAHPLIKSEMQAKSFVGRAWVKIGVINVPKRQPGRPPLGGLGVRPRRLYERIDAGEKFRWLEDEDITNET
jgi:hypothetical protein